MKEDDPTKTETETETDVGGDGGYRLYRHPLSDVDPAKMTEALLALAREGVDDFPALMRQIDSTFRAAYPPHVIAVLAAWGLSTSVSSKGTEKSTIMSEVNQHHVEILQALALRLDYWEWGTEPAAPEDIQATIDAVKAAANHFHARRYAKVAAETDAAQKMVLLLQEKLRLHTQFVRNWGAYPHMVGIARSLYSPLDAQLRAVAGYGPSDVLRIAEALVTLSERRMTSRITNLREIFAEPTIPKFVHAFFAKFAYVEGDPDAFVAGIPSDTEFAAVKQRLLAHADRSLGVVFDFSTDAIASEVGLEAGLVQKILKDISLTPGDLHAVDPEAFFLANPIWQSPLMAVADNFFCPVPMSLWGQIHLIIAKIAETYGLKADFEKRRARYLEETLEEIFSANLGVSPKANVKWRLGTEQFETDLFVVLDQVAVIVEAKSSALSAAGLRGAPDRMKRHIQELVTAPSEQSARLVDLVVRAQKGDAEAVRILAPFGTDFRRIQTIVRLSVTLEDFSVLSSSEIELKRAGLIPEGLKLAPTLNVADLTCVAETLSEPAYFIDYLIQRDRLQGTMRLVADEVDFLGCYLENGLNFDGIDGSENRLILSGMSEAIDHYYQSQHAGVDVPKPKLKVPDYFRFIIEVLRERNFPHWLPISLDILRNMGVGDQGELIAQMEKLRVSVQVEWPDEDHPCSVMISPVDPDAAALVIYVYPPAMVEKRKEIAMTLINKAFETGRKRCVLVARNTDHWHWPYDFVYQAAAEA
ncbi:hypothetical protein [Asticcacaulis solisilvae]|uniref:hypothetical protein n=1 Tax=Asticcacaulis solisilvae TaxID=1217274 RepID=UPI003FD700E4